MMGPMTEDAAVRAAAKLAVYFPSCVIIFCISLPELGGVREGRARHSREDDALHDVDVSEAAAEAPDERVAEAQQPFRDAADGHELGGEDEQRYGQQHEARVHAVESCSAAVPISRPARKR